MQVMLAQKEVECKCGNVITMSSKKTWCEKCCRPVFYYAKDQRKDRLNNFYLLAVMALVFGFLSYLFVEMIAVPLLSISL